MHSLPDILQNTKQELLKKGSKKAAWVIINEYFKFMGMESIPEELWIMTKEAITNDLMDRLEKGLERHDLLFNYEFLVMFFDAVKMLHDKREKKQKQPNYLSSSNKIKTRKSEAQTKAASLEPKGLV